MTIREKIIRQSISKIEKRLTKIQEILDFDWLAERNSLLEKWNSLSPSQQRKQVNAFVTAEKKLNNKMNLHLNSAKLIQEKATLSLEHAALKNELYWIEGLEKSKFLYLLNKK